ncbi:hypothetical protein KSS87_005439, partial [Heliosperma pusillum]
MGKTEMSSSLKNLKFMQREAPKEEEVKVDEEPMPDGNFIPPSNFKRKCVVILEGDPQPGTTRGRMSFQNFNPSIDKLKEEEAANGYGADASTSSLFQSGRGNERYEGNGELKRKQPKEFSQTSHPKKQQKQSQGYKQPSPSDNRSSHNQPKREKLDFNVLVPQKSQ